MRISTILLVTIALLLATSVCRAQCADWRGRPILHLDGTVYAATTWDPDGAGPQPALLVVGGDFTRAGGPAGVAASNIAAWNGSSWQALGAGVNGPVRALAVFNGQLVVGGDFDTAGAVSARGVAQWNGSAWQALGTGVGYQVSSEAGVVYSLLPYNGTLIVGGVFNTAGPVTAWGVARWTGSAWQAVGDLGVQGPIVLALASYNNQIVAGGIFRNAAGQDIGAVMRWTGSAWQFLGPGSSAQPLSWFVNTLAVYQNQLIAGGLFDTLGAPSTACLARWNGSAWQSVGTLQTGALPLIRALTVYNGELVVTGSFDGLGGQSAANIARWNGVSWQPLGAGVGDETHALAVYAGELVVGGDFPSPVAPPARGLARWNGSTWIDMPGIDKIVTGTVAALAPWAGQMIIGGVFRASGADRFEVIKNLAAFDGRRITSVGSPAGPVYALATAPGPSHSTDLIAAGNFLYVDGVPANRIARLNDTLPGGWQAMGDGFSAQVAAVAYYNGSIYAGGSFLQSGSTSISYIARWNGSAWVPVGSGANGPVFALRVYNGSLYAGGSFTSIGGSSASHIARWDGAWHSVGAGLGGSYATDMAVYNNQLVIVGVFPGIAGSPNVIRWDGSAFSSLGSGGADGPVYAATVSDGTLVIGGSFSSVGGFNCANMARWNGSTWHSWAGATDGAVNALASLGNELHVGGSFNFVRSGGIDSPLWARFSEDGTPWIAEQPASGERNCGQTFSPTVGVAAGYGGLGFQWRKNGVPLVNGPTGTGSTIIGATGNFGVLNVGTSDQGAYDCVVSSGCGSVTSAAAILTVINYANCDGSTVPPVLNVNDFVCFQSRFAAGDPWANCDGSTVVPVLNVNDFVCFQQRFAAGCP